MPCRAEKLDTCAQMTDLVSSIFFRSILLNFTKEVVCLLFLFCKFKRSVFQVPSCCSIWLSSWISSGTAEQLSTLAQACTHQHDLHSSARTAHLSTICTAAQDRARNAAAEFCSSSSSSRAPPPNPLLGLRCVRQPFTPAC